MVSCDLVEFQMYRFDDVTEMFSSIVIWARDHSYETGCYLVNVNVPRYFLGYQGWASDHTMVMWVTRLTMVKETAPLFVHMEFLKTPKGRDDLARFIMDGNLK